MTAGGTLLAADGVEIVLAGLAFPQDADTASELQGPTVAAEAVARLAKGPLRIASEGPPDRYGRPHANAYLPDGRWLQEELVAAGLALVRPEGGDGDCVLALLEREAAARASGAGFWADFEHPRQTHG